MFYLFIRVRIQKEILKFYLCLNKYNISFTKLFSFHFNLGLIKGNSTIPVHYLTFNFHFNSFPFWALHPID